MSVQSVFAHGLDGFVLFTYSFAMRNSNRDVSPILDRRVSPSGRLWNPAADVYRSHDGWIVKVDRRTGKVLGAMPSGGTHSIEVNANGEPLTGVRPDKAVWYRPAGGAAGQSKR